MMELLTQALSFLPHGAEFRFVDAVTKLDPGKSAEGEYTVRGDEPFLRGHFPGEPIFPGVLLIEAAAQLAGIAAQSDPHLSPLPGLKLTAVKSAKVTGTARPGQRIRIKATVLGRMGHLIQAESSINLNDQPILQAQLTLSGDLA